MNKLNRQRNPLKREVRFVIKISVWRFDLFKCDFFKKNRKVQENGSN